MADRQDQAPPPAEGEALLVLDRIGKRYGSVVAVDEVALRIGPGQFVTLLGPSGSGKTTCLNMTAGFERPDHGEVVLAGERITDLPPYRRRLNTVFQGYALFPHLDVKGNVGFGLRMMRTDKGEARRRVAEALEMVQLSPLADRRVDQLSGGQQQRVALARALVNRPQLVLLDEPLSALDAQLRKSMQRELKAIQEHAGLTFIYVTHDQEEALVLSDRICLMNQGRVEQEGAPSDLYHRPASRFAAQFIGRNNFLAGEVCDEGAAPFLLLAGGLRVGLNGNVGPRRGPAVVAVRPECLSIAERPGEATLPAQVLATRFLGDRIEAQLQTPAGVPLSLFVDREPPPAGGHVHVRVPAEHCTVLWDAG
jgi:ABC-type Fe3+/spermidine/putrescine transport system ATPase subunit